MPSAAVISDVTFALEGFQFSLNSLTGVVMGDRFALDFLLACQS